MAERLAIRRVALPIEHGGWSLTLEPVLLGLLAAPGRPGAALGVAALLAFLVRTPLKVTIGDRLRGRHLDRTRLADRVVAVEALLFAVALGYAAQGRSAMWLPVLVASPLFALELWYDVRSHGRRLIPELAGAVGIGSIAAAIALAGDLEAGAAWGLWLVLGSRAAAAIPFVRSQIRRSKGRSAGSGAMAAQLLAAGAVAGGVVADVVPIAGAAAVGIMAAAHLVWLRLRPPRVPVLGAQQVVLGLGVVVATALGVRAP